MNAAFFRARVHGGPEPEAAGRRPADTREPPAAGDVHLLPGGGLGMSITIGIVDVLFVQADAVKKGRCLDSNWREDLYRLNRSQSWLPTIVTQAGSATTAHISTCLNSCLTGV
ncbi:MAG TPA: hypothetical protein VJ301_03525 [Propionibacteriaceae bacterium]|nr:hypothetical protein [Propionibacteriaceae bacterium]